MAFWRAVAGRGAFVSVSNSSPMGKRNERFTVDEIWRATNAPRLMDRTFLILHPLSPLAKSVGASTYPESTNSVLLIMVSPLSNSSGSMGCPEEYSWARDPRFDPVEEEIRQGLDDAAMDDPPDCPHVANMQDIARRLRDRVAGLEADIAHQHHNTGNVEATNEGLFHRLSSFSVDNRQLKKYLAEARALAAGSAADAAEYKGGLFIVGWLLIMAVAHILFVKTDF